MSLPRTIQELVALPPGELMHLTWTQVQTFGPTWVSTYSDRYNVSPTFRAFLVIIANPHQAPAQFIGTRLTPEEINRLQLFSIYACSSMVLPNIFPELFE